MKKLWIIALPLLLAVLLLAACGQREAETPPEGTLPAGDTALEAKEPESPRRRERSS